MFGPKAASSLAQNINQHGYTITIQSNGNTVIQNHGMNSSTVYQSPFQETMEAIMIKDGYASTCDQPKSESDPVPCKTELYE
jgi:hypothetical protein